MTITVSKRKTTVSSSASFLSAYSLLTHGIVGLLCLYVGLQAGVATTGPSQKSSCNKCESLAGGKIDATVSGNCDQNANSARSEEKDRRDKSTFPPSLRNMFVEFATVPREDFNKHLEIGVPLDDTKKGAEDALILYTHQNTLPSKGHLLKAKAKHALANCASVKVILMEPAKRKGQQCLAILPQWESYHVHKFMRLPKRTGALDMKKPLRYVSRSHNEKGTSSGVPELHRHTEPAYERLIEYLTNLPSLVKDLEAIVKDMLEKSSNPKSRTVIVQICNYGQVELFHNFLCSAKARGLDYSHVFMFATDEKTYGLCQELGIPSYYNEAIFGNMPETAAKAYGDRVFVKMMMAKVYCVHLILSTGYNVLFQDVDIVWYKNPLKYLESHELSEWDMMFQDDGNRQARYAPFSPNSGFYFVRNNPKTTFLFSMLLRMSDVIHKQASHQAALNALINEHVSWKGLRVKVWRKGDQNPFPGGFEYHNRKPMMKQLMTGTPKVEPFIFHMSWTRNKDNKKKFFQQMGEWFVKEDCEGDGWNCCVEEPEITCHYRDKASKIPCHDVPPIDNGRASYWK